jgi:hypothetical protein
MKGASQCKENEIFHWSLSEVLCLATPYHSANGLYHARADIRPTTAIGSGDDRFHLEAVDMKKQINVSTLLLRTPEIQKET